MKYFLSFCKYYFNFSQKIERNKKNFLRFFIFQCFFVPLKMNRFFITISPAKTDTICGRVLLTRLPTLSSAILQFSLRLQNVGRVFRDATQSQAMNWLTIGTTRIYQLLIYRSGRAYIKHELSFRITSGSTIQTCETTIENILIGKYYKGLVILFAMD